MTTLAKLIDRRLTELSRARAEFAADLGVVPVSVSRWLRPQGDCPIPWRHYPKIADILHIPLQDVLRAAAKDHPRHVALYHHFAGTGPQHEPKRRRTV